ncbi:MAG TPA: YciI family protein [Euzebyales bacterium]|nr:YciI family protein [Euzebyales bacterium]
MKYVILIHSNPASREVWEGLSRTERVEGLRAYAALNEHLGETGEMIVTEALADPSYATRVTARDGQVITSDGPFAEAKEHLAGFYLVECDSPDRAVEIAAQVPEAGLGLVEVRPVLSLDDLAG